MDPLSGQVYLLALVYISIMVVLTLLFRLFFRDTVKAGMAAFLVMALNFFFGNLQDFLKRNLAGTFFIKYSFLLPLFLLLLLLLFWYIRHPRRRFIKTTHYLNLLFAILLVIDLVQIIYKESKRFAPYRSVKNSLKDCTDCPRPDIYMIVADEYAGARQLKEQFGFDNSAFDTALQQRGFRVLTGTNSNYNFTMHSMASMLNFSYVHGIDGKFFRHEEAFTCRRLIENNLFTRYLRQQGYEIFNYSFLELEGTDKNADHYYFMPVAAYLNRQTLIGRMNFDLGFHVASKEKIDQIRMNEHLNNVKLITATREQAARRSAQPRLIYTHLSLPHHPYYFDRNGKPRKFEGLTAQEIPGAYTDYLQYANGQLISLIDAIQKRSQTPPVILLLSDHGFRQYKVNQNGHYQFMNISAVYMPGGNTSGFYEGMSNVNLLRVFMNNLFHQKMPLLKDSTIFLKE